MLLKMTGAAALLSRAGLAADYGPRSRGAAAPRTPL